MFKNKIIELINLSNLGSIASILGFVITVSVFFKIRQLYARFLFIARIPEHIEQLRHHRSNLRAQLQNFDVSLDEIRMELAECEANLKSLKRKLQGETRKSVLVRYMLHGVGDARCRVSIRSGITV